MNQTPAQRRAVSHTPGKTNQPKHSLPLSYCRNIYSAFPDLGLASWQAAPQKESLPLASPSSAKQETFQSSAKAGRGTRQAAGVVWSSPGEGRVSAQAHARRRECGHLFLCDALGISNGFGLITSARNDTGAKEVMGSKKTYLFSFLNGDFFPFPTKHNEALKRI